MIYNVVLVSGDQQSDSVMHIVCLFSFGFSSQIGENEMRACSIGLTLCDPMDCSPPGSSVHGILQARILESAALTRHHDRCGLNGRSVLSQSCFLLAGHGSPPLPLLAVAPLCRGPRVPRVASPPLLGRDPPTQPPLT